MSYGEKLGERREARKVKYREFTEVGMHQSYIHKIISGEVLPTVELRDAIGTLMGQVALEQDADALEEQRMLREAWWETKLEELEVNPDIVPVTARLFSAAEEVQIVGARALEEALEMQPAE